MKQLFECLLTDLQQARPAVLATVVASSGSAPGGALASMLVNETGRRAGTVGGGAVEFQAEKRAAQVLAQGHSQTENYTLYPGGAEDIGMVCGGEVSIHFCRIAPSEAAIHWVRQALACFDKDEDAWLLMDLAPGGGQLGLYTESNGLLALEPTAPTASFATDKIQPLLGTGPVRHEIAGQLFYGEPLVRAGRVVVFGGGHIAQALAPVLAPLGFRTVVYDDRPEFACRSLFPHADELIVADFGHVDEHIALTSRDWLVIVTRGHAADFDIQRQVLGRPFAYVGVIGSRAKTKAVNQRLREAGIPEAAISSVHTPIGLAIGAETPAEIAISIAAEMIQIRAELYSDY